MLYCFPRYPMDAIQKFVSDIDRIKKRVRAEGSYSGEKASRMAQDLFERNNKHLGDLAHSFSEYWLDTYILTSSEMQEEPTAAHIQILAQLQAVLDGEVELTQDLTPADWKALCELTNAEAEALDIDTLNTLMSQFVEHQAL